MIVTPSRYRRSTPNAMSKSVSESVGKRLGATTESDPHTFTARALSTIIRPSVATMRASSGAVRSGRMTRT